MPINSAIHYLHDFQFQKYVGNSLISANSNVLLFKGQHCIKVYKI